MRRSCIRRIDARPSVYALNGAHGAAAQLYTPSGLPYQHGRPVASACRNRQTGSALCRAKAAKRSASARAPDGAVGPRLVHIPPAPSGSQRSPAVGRSRRLQARSCGNRSRGGTLIRMRSQSSSPGRPLNHSRRSRSPQPIIAPDAQLLRRGVLDPGRAALISKRQVVCNAWIAAVGTVPSTRRARSASRVTNASACSCVSATYSAS